MDISKMSDCRQKETSKFIKFSKDLIDGYSCVKNGCGRTDCKACDWNTETPYITIGGTSYYVSRPMVGWNTTGFNEDEDFYIIIEKFGIMERIIFVSEETFNNTFVAV